MKKFYTFILSSLIAFSAAGQQTLTLSITRDPNPNNANPEQTIRVRATPSNNGSFPNTQAWSAMNLWFRFPKDVVRDVNSNIYNPAGANAIPVAPATEFTNISTGFNALSPRNQFIPGSLSVSLYDKSTLTNGASSDNYWYFAISQSTNGTQGIAQAEVLNIWTFSVPASWGLCGSCLEILQTDDAQIFQDTYPNIQYGSAPVVNAATFSNFTSPLPIQLTNFVASKTSERVGELSWVTAQEKDMNYFEVERSADGRYFSTKIGKAAATNGGQTVTYALLDKTPLPGDNYYRLKMIEKDGTVTYSEVRKLNFDRFTVNSVTVLKNPFAEATTIRVTAEGAQTANYILTDAVGRTIQNGTWNIAAGDNTFPVSLSGLASGTYMLLVKGSSVSGQLKLLKAE